MYNIIFYSLRRGVKPAEVIEVLDALIEKHSAAYEECLFDVKVSICEFEHNGKFHSNRKRNAVNTLLKRHPQLEPYYKHSSEDRGGPEIAEDVSISNFAQDDFLCTGEIDYTLINDIVKQVPRPYGVNELHLIFNGVRFGNADKESDKIRASESGFDAPVGNYIWYLRENYGDEKHSSVLFAADGRELEAMRKLFFEFADTVPGRYNGTQLHR